MIYFFTFFLIFGLWKYLYPSSSVGDRSIVYNRKRKRYHVIVSIWIILLLVLRHDLVGTDTQNYRALFDYMNYGFEYGPDTNIGSEIGFYSLVSALVGWGMNFRMLLVINAVLYVGTVSFLIYKYSQKPWLSYFIFITFGFFIFTTTMRQCFALAFTIIALQFAINKKLIPYLLFVALAVSFHSTAVVFLPAYWIIRMPLKKRTALLLGLIFIVIYASIDFILSYAVELTNKGYEERETGGIFTFCMNLFFVIVGWMNIRKMAAENRIWILLLCMVLCLFPVAKVNPAMMRIYMYFSIYIIILAPNLVIPRYQIRNLVMCFIFLVGIYKFTYGAKASGVRIHPYVFYWEDYYELNPEARSLHLE